MSGGRGDGAIDVALPANMPTCQRGFTFLGLMFVVILLTLTASMASAVWSTAQRREKERELVFAGRQFQAAIERYHLAHAAKAAPYPRRLEDMLADDQAPQPLRALRRIYTDPITGTRDWGLVRLPDGGIVGVYSQSDRVTLLGEEVAARPGSSSAPTYREWRFIAASAAETILSAAVAAPSRPVAAGPRRAGSAPFARPAPAEAVAPSDSTDPAPTTTAPVLRPRQDDYRARTPEACSRIAAYDEKTCSDLEARLGADAALVCRDSAVSRNLACTLGTDGPMPGLVLQP